MSLADCRAKGGGRCRLIEHPDEVCRIAERGLPMGQFGQLAKGMADYRAGRFASAIKTLEEFDPNSLELIPAIATRWPWLESSCAIAFGRGSAVGTVRSIDGDARRPDGRLRRWMNSACRWCGSCTRCSRCRYRLVP